MDTTAVVPRKVPKRVRKHARLSRFFHGDSTISHWIFGPINQDPHSPCNAPRYSSPEPRESPRVRSPSSTRSVIDPFASPNLGDDIVDLESSGRFWEDVERRVNLPYPWNQSRVAVIPDERLPRSSPKSRRWAWVRPRNPMGKPASRTCFPTIGDDRFRRNTIGFLVSGLVLVLILSTCASPGGSLHTQLMTVSQILRWRYPGQSRANQLTLDSSWSSSQQLLSSALSSFDLVYS